MKIREIAKQSPLEEGAGAVISKLTPAYGVADAAYRAKEGDWLGAGIAGVATGLGLVPPVGPPGVAAQAGSIGLDAFNVLRDIAKERGGWKNLGKELIKAARDSGDFDQAGMGTMYESFAEIDRLDESGQLDEGIGVEFLKKLGKYGGDVIDWAKNLRKSKPDADLAADASTRVEPKLEPIKTPAEAPTKGPVDLEKEFAKREADRIAAAEREAVEKAAAEAERLKNLELPKQGRFERDKKYLARLEKMGPEYAAAHRQRTQDFINLKTAKQLERGIARKAAIGAGKYIGLPSLVGGSLGVASQYAPDVIDAAKETFKRDKEEAEQRGVKLPFPEPAAEPEQQAPAPASPSSAEQPAEQPSKPPAEPAASGKIEVDPKVGPPPAGETQLEKDRREKGLPSSSSIKSDRPIAERKASLSEKYQQFLNDAEEKPSYTKDQYIGWAKKYSEQYNVPLSMVLHAMFKETGWLGDAERMRTATSPTGARGVMQIQPQYAEKGAYKIKVKDLTDPEKNIEAGVRGLAYYFNKHKTPEKALAAYNAGEGGAATFLKTGDVNTLRTKETRNYIKGFKDDVIYQLEKFYPKNKDKVAQVATDVLATVVGAGNAQAAGEIPPAQGGPENPIKIKSYSKTDKLPPAPNAAELAKINKRLQNYKDPVKELEKIIQQADAAGQKTDTLKKELDNLKQDYEKDRAGKTVVPADDPNSTYINVGPVRLKVDGKLKSPKFPSIQSDIPSGDYQSQGDATPAKVKPPVEQPKSQQSISGTIDRGSDAPNLAPQKSKADSNLDKPAKGVSTATVPPKSEPPAKAQAEPQADPNAAKGLAGSDKGKKKEKTTTNKVVAEPDADAKVNVRKEFEKAFAQARAEKGPGQTFTFKDPRTNKEGTFTTDYADEVKPKGKASKAGVDDAITQIIKGKKVPSLTIEPTSDRIDQLVKDKLNKELDQNVSSDYTVDVDPDALKVPSIPAIKSDVKTDKPADVLRSTDGTPVSSGTGEPWGTGTSKVQDIERAKAELQKKIADEKAKRELEKVSPDLSTQEPESFIDKWNRGIDTLTGNRRPPADRETIRVPESVNTELKDILWLAGRTKK